MYERYKLARQETHQARHARSLNLDSRGLSQHYLKVLLTGIFQFLTVIHGTPARGYDLSMPVT